MSGAAPVLELIDALADPAQSGLPSVPVDISLMPGDCALIDTRDQPLAAEFADLCCGLVPLRGGHVRFLGRDWAEISEEQAAALRGRIGRMSQAGSWIDFLGTDVNILLSQLHHTTRAESILRERAADLARRFALPGLPLARPAELTAEDLARAACVRAFLGEPLMILLESPAQGRFVDLMPSLLEAVVESRDRGATVIWLTRSDMVWADHAFPATVRLRFMERGLMPVRN